MDNHLEKLLEAIFPSESLLLTIRMNIESFWGLLLVFMYSTEKYHIIYMRFIIIFIYVGVCNKILGRDDVDLLLSSSRENTQSYSFFPKSNHFQVLSSNRIDYLTVV